MKNVNLRQLVLHPIFVMVAVLAMYAIKVVCKITIGTSINSPMLTADGFHNVADMFEASAIILIIMLSRRAPNANYPFGRKQVEFLSSLTIGITLCLLALSFAVQSITGLLSYAPTLDATVRSYLPLPEFHPLVLSAAAFPWVVAVTAGSVILSLSMSRYQIAIGKASGHQSLIADGEETASDGRIEMVALVGVLCEYLFQAAWLEYPLGLFVAFLVAKTAAELIKGGWRALLLSTIGTEHEDEIRVRCLRTPGVREVAELKTFRVGHTAVCMLTLVVRADTRKVDYIKYGVEQSLAEYLTGDEFKACDIQVKFRFPAPERHRVAIALRADERGIFVADTLAAATQLMICDIEDERIVRSKSVSSGDFAMALKDKRVRDLYIFRPDLETDEVKAVVAVIEAPTYVPSVMGIDVRHESMLESIHRMLTSND